MSLRDKQDRALEDLCNAIERYHELKHGRDAFLGSTSHTKYVVSRSRLKTTLQAVNRVFFNKEET